MSDITQADQRTPPPLRKILDAAAQGFSPAATAAENFLHSAEHKVDAAVQKYAPFLERAPALTRQAIETAFEELAKHCEATAENMIQAAMQRAAELKATAGQLRGVGQAHAVNTENLMSFARDAGALFKAEADKALSFRPADVAPHG